MESSRTHFEVLSLGLEVQVLGFGRRVARIWKRGGAILKEWEKCKRPWPEFSLFLNQFHTVYPKIETKFIGKVGNSNVFSAQKQVVSKKKKGLHRNWDWFFGRNLKFKRFFRVKAGGLQKKKKVFTEIETDFSAVIRNSKVFSAQKQVVSKKKRSSPKLRLIFRPNSEIQTFEGGLFSYGGAIFNFLHKIGLKSTKNVRFCIFHKPMGGLEPPLATLMGLGLKSSKIGLSSARGQHYFLNC